MFQTQICFPHKRACYILDNQPPWFTTSTVLYAFRGRQLLVHLQAVDPEYRDIEYTFAQNETFGASLSKSGIFAWIQNTNSQTMFKFRVTDECGAYSVLNTSVVIKECPCQNAGECFPDKRDLDGLGNFTCSCPAEYTGTLCENDIDECELYKPCSNGTCINQHPGYSCSCYAGYTDRHCETEVTNLQKSLSIIHVYTYINTCLISVCIH